jgi:hypothetical protein
MRLGGDKQIATVLCYWRTVAWILRPGNLTGSLQTDLDDDPGWVESKMITGLPA